MRYCSHIGPAGATGERIEQMFGIGMYRVVRVTPGRNPGIDGCYLRPQSGWMTYDEARALAFQWIDNIDSRDILELEHRVTRRLSDSMRGRKSRGPFDL